ncbi:transcriptional regulator EpsA [compost metagenome]
MESSPASEKTGDAFALTVFERMGGNSSRGAKLTEAENVPVVGSFNTREMEILGMVSAGMLNREIGNRLGMTEGSVKWYLQQIYDKLGIRRRSQAVERARQLGIIQ